MNRIKRIGLILIIIGMFVPVISYPFTTPTQDAIVMQTVYWTKGFSYELRLTDIQVKANDNISIKYKYLLAFGIILTFAGISVVTLKRIK